MACGLESREYGTLLQLLKGKDLGTVACERVNRKGWEGYRARLGGDYGNRAGLLFPADPTGEFLPARAPLELRRNSASTAKP
jgi:hypothetical protein